MQENSLQGNTTDSISLLGCLCPEITKPAPLQPEPTPTFKKIENPYYSPIAVKKRNKFSKSKRPLFKDRLTFESQINSIMNENPCNANSSLKSVGNRPNNRKKYRNIFEMEAARLSSIRNKRDSRYEKEKKTSFRLDKPKINNKLIYSSKHLNNDNQRLVEYFKMKYKDYGERISNSTNKNTSNVECSQIKSGDTLNIERSLSLANRNSSINRNASKSCSLVMISKNLLMEVFYKLIDRHLAMIKTELQISVAAFIKMEKNLLIKSQLREELKTPIKKVSFSPKLSILGSITKVIVKRNTKRFTIKPKDEKNTLKSILKNSGEHSMTSLYSGDSSDSTSSSDYDSESTDSDIKTENYNKKEFAVEKERNSV